MYKRIAMGSKKLEDVEYADTMSVSLHTYSQIIEKTVRYYGAAENIRLKVNERIAKFMIVNSRGD